MKIDIKATQDALCTVMALGALPSEDRKRMYRLLCEFDKRGMPPKVFFDIMKKDYEQNN